MIKAERAEKGEGRRAGNGTFFLWFYASITASFYGVLWNLLNYTYA